MHDQIQTALIQWFQIQWAPHMGSFPVVWPNTGTSSNGQSVDGPHLSFAVSDGGSVGRDATDTIRVHSGAVIVNLFTPHGLGEGFIRDMRRQVTVAFHDFQSPGFDWVDSWSLAGPIQPNCSTRDRYLVVSQSTIWRNNACYS